jgi:hypothetical protein
MGERPSEHFQEVVDYVMSNDALVKALESLTEDPPSTLDEPDEDWEVIVKMRAIAREALASLAQPPQPGERRG